MSTPIHEIDEPRYSANTTRFPGNENIFEDEDAEYRGRDNLRLDTLNVTSSNRTDPSPSATREQALRLDDDLAVLQAERVVSSTQRSEEHSEGTSLRQLRSRTEPVDEFDIATNPLHETAAIYNAPEDPHTNIARALKRIHSSSFLVRYFFYITPLTLIILIPLLLGALVFKTANVGGVQLLWFSIWLEIFWLTLWAGRITAKCFPPVFGIVSSIFTNNSKKYRDLGRELELPLTLFFWWLGVEVSFLPTMINHHVDGNRSVKEWENTMNKVIVSIFVGAILNLIEKIIIQLIAISFHTRTYADRIEINKFQISNLTKLYAFSRERISEKDEDFEERASGTQSGAKTPLNIAGTALKVGKKTLNKVGDMAGAVAGDFTGKKINKSSHPHQVVLALLSTNKGGQVLARRLYRTFVRDGFETIFSGDLKSAFDNNEEAEAAFTMFDKDMNGDISMEELEAVCVEIGRERKSITASLKDLDSVVSRLDAVLFFIVCVITLLVFLSLISTSAAGVLTSAGSTILALSWLFSATAQEFLQSVIFVFVKHPFDVGDRVTIYGNTGDMMKGDDYFVKEISLLYTEFKKMQGHVVQAPNSYLNTLFILNQRRSGGLAEAVPVIIKYGTTMEQMDALRQRLLEFVRTEKREYQPNILTELREVTEAFSLTLNVVFFYKSNWQNEGLRLQRRNKFICMLMLSMQEIGIEGPRMNLQGAHVDYPFHVNHHGQPPSYAASTRPGPNQQQPISSSSETILEEHEPNFPENAAYSSGSNAPIRPQHSILRKGSMTAAARARGESLSRPGRHVDFSLGNSALVTNDLMGDVFEDRTPSRLEEVVRNANREAMERRIRDDAAASRESLSSASRHPAPAGFENRPRASMESRGSAAGRPSLSSSLGGRSGFLSRLGSHHSRVRSTDSDDLMEQAHSMNRLHWQGYGGAERGPEWILEITSGPNIHQAVIWLQQRAVNFTGKLIVSKSIQ
ncbi:Mechanosensitive ion channel family [Talaromyces stipitatus ATCC 10500]|uniref:Mechanosensitive ion channel protein n=1 Tax=Talaromyces stipitatus (strain ATCC 10500 / CBS 375.48 / QM 6759 / NRRL 1006) TaxID=441959 RepID=B8LXW9_TALSN|nr:Mechanosensitive ion channel family [Talaromyces stipitatus ATCC 10500]EED22784.1 Mechanosensitive ion channel family [Talaromyces stipitatus ATCC 10500]